MVTLARNLVPDILCPTRLPCPQENNPRHTENLQSLVAGRLSLMHHRHPSPHNFRVSVLPGSVSRFQIPSIIIIINFPFTCSLSHAIFLLPGVTHKKAGWVRLAQIPYRPWYRAVDDESTKDTCSPSMKSTLPLHATSMPIRESQIPGEPVVRLPLPPQDIFRPARCGVDADVTCLRRNDDTRAHACVPIPTSALCSEQQHKTLGPSGYSNDDDNVPPVFHMRSRSQPP
jgi:hypothetical protein